MTDWRDLDDDTPVMVCGPAYDDDPIPGSVKRAADCGHEVWLAPTGQAMVEERGIEHFVCGDCFVDAAHEDEKLVEAIQPMTPAQLAEVAAAIMEDELRAYQGPEH